MKGILDFVRSSIGKKLFMALTGLAFCGFLAVHLIGNLTMYGGGKLLNAYAATLHLAGPAIIAAELGLLALAAVHIAMAVILVYGSFFVDRPQRYAVKKAEGGRTISSATMPYTGALIIVFLVIHLLQFRFVNLEQQTLATVVAGVLTRPAFAALYIAFMIVVALHVRHGFWSAFQTIGLNHPKYMPAIQVLSVVFGLVVAVGFGSLPILVVMGGLG
jgi:succinate dehydrogenase / fumarate reductase, cytochrome b subunit